MYEWVFSASFDDRLSVGRDASVVPATRVVCRRNVFGWQNVPSSSAFHLSHDPQDLRRERRLVAHCGHGSEVSQKVGLAGP